MKKLMLLTGLLATISMLSSFAAEDPLKGKVKIKNNTNNNYTVIATYKNKNVFDDQRYLVSKKSSITIKFEDKENKTGPLKKLASVDSKGVELATIEKIKEKAVYILDDKGFTKE